MALHFNEAQPEENFVSQLFEVLVYNSNAISCAAKTENDGERHLTV